MNLATSFRALPTMIMRPLRNGLFHRSNCNRNAQLLIVLVSALTLKLYYSTASVNQLRWILAPTASLVELVTGLRFEFESYAGYINSDRTFVIAASCAGVNFLITAFLMLSLRKLWIRRSQNLPWRFIPMAAMFSYLATLVANTFRISTALRMRELHIDVGLSANQLHRLEGIVVYFGFLMLLFLLSEKMSARNTTGFRKSLVSDSASGVLRQAIFPLLIYYATALGFPLLNGAYQGSDFREHSLFVFLTPLILIIPLAAFGVYRDLRSRRVQQSTESGS